ncbi:MAG TPA: VWA domain-containing protein [Thermomicrobiales bacterium]
MADNDYVNPYDDSRGDDLLEQAEFPDNTETRCPVVLCLDISGSMNGPAIDEVNQGLQMLGEAWRKDKLASKRVEVALVTFGGGVSVLDLRTGSGEPIDPDPYQAFVTPDYMRVPMLTAGGDTPMGNAVRIAVQLLTGRKEIYKQAGADYNRPQLYLFTDGHPTDPDWESGAQALRQEEERRGVSVWPFGVEGADFAKLSRFARRRPVRIPNNVGQFQEFFEWLSKSVAAVANSGEGANQVAAPGLATGWDVIEL